MNSGNIVRTATIRQLQRKHSLTAIQRCPNRWSAPFTSALKSCFIRFEDTGAHLRGRVTPERIENCLLETIWQPSTIVFRKSLTRLPRKRTKRRKGVLSRPCREVARVDGLFGRNMAQAFRQKASNVGRPLPTRGTPDRHARLSTLHGAAQIIRSELPSKRAGAATGQGNGLLDIPSFAQPFPSSTYPPIQPRPFM